MTRLLRGFRALVTALLWTTIPNPAVWLFAFYIAGINHY